MTEPISGSRWFPPDLDQDVAKAISDLWWDIDPHWAAYLAWTDYAATLPPVAPVSSVGTGIQTVMYPSGALSGPLGAALARAEWHRSMSSYGGLVSVPLASDSGLREALSGSYGHGWWTVEPVEATP